MIAQPTALTLPARLPRASTRPPLRGPELRPRFTLDGSRELEQHLERTCVAIAAGIRGLIPAHRLEGILLGGGYGRGEGGVLQSPAGDRPYNDLEFYVFLRGNRHLNERRYGRALHVLGEILTPQAGIEVEFKISSLRELQAAPVSMFSYDLVTGHYRLFGAEPLLAGATHHRDATQIPLAEATRLLMNRGSGLLFARERLERPSFTPADADFVARNIAKAELALGDAVLVAHGAYHWSARERHLQLGRIGRDASLPWLDEVRRVHGAAVQFKLHPTRSTDTRELLQTRHAAVAMLAETVWLWLEERRLGRPYGSSCDYALCPLDKWPGSPRGRNLLVTAKAAGLRALTCPDATRHPRERILNALALLLWCPAALADRLLLARLQRDLFSKETSFAGLIQAYRQLWSQVN